jgi:hypothetical protein
MLSLGITLSNCDVVMLFNNTLSSDRVMQQMYRCMTEGKEKKFGFVIDLNISRILNTCINYSIHKKDLSIEEKLKYMFDYHLMNIDVDMWENKKLDSNYLINKLLDIWKNDPINNLKTMLRNLDNEYLEFDNETQKLLNKSFTSSANEKIKASIEFKDENDESQSIQSGKEISKTEDSEKELNDMEKDLLEEEKKEKEISFTKDVLPHVIPLTCILTMSDTNKDFIKMLTNIKENPELLEVFDEQSLIWWNKKDLINIIKNIVEKFINKNSNTFNISINFKMGLKSLIDKPKELLELINECLKPKEIEKKKFGEVFTPMKLVNEMLDKLPKEVWENKNLKWLDPCVGMGNFMIGVYLRLIEGLKKEIPNEKKRKSHILEKMLYMCELNKKNCYIVKQIFNINNEYKLNIYEGDFLKFDSKKKFNIEKFDIILGNPPYQEKKENFKKTKPLWHIFVLNSLSILNKNGYLLMIHPCGWRSPRGIFRDVYDNIMKRELMFLSINDFNKGRETFGVGTNYDYYCLKNKKSNSNTTNVNDVDGNNHNLNLNNYSFIPNGKFEIFNNLIANDKDEKINVLYSRSDYGTDKKWMSSKKTNEYKYPCCYTITLNNGMNLYYSTTNENGHFKLPKVIWSNGLGTYPIIDINGEYGLTQFSYGIIDNKKNLEVIKKVLESEKFIGLFNYCKFTNNKYDYKVISTFKKDFYNQFIEDNKIVKRSISNKTQKEKNNFSDSDEEKPKIKVKKNKSTMTKTK